MVCTGSSTCSLDFCILQNLTQRGNQVTSIASNLPHALTPKIIQQTTSHKRYFQPPLQLIIHIQKMKLQSLPLLALIAAADAGVSYPTIAVSSCPTLLPLTDDICICHCVKLYSNSQFTVFSPRLTSTGFKNHPLDHLMVLTR